MAAKKKRVNKRDVDWAEAKRRCGLSAEEVRMAKEMGIRPRTLIKNRPSRDELWKGPVGEWVRDMYERRQAKAARKRARREAHRASEDSGEASDAPPD